MITSREIEVFLLKKKGLSVTAIANSLNISQPAASRALKKAKLKINELKNDKFCFLAKREKEVLELKEKGKTQLEIASMLNISQPVVSEYYRTAKRKIAESERILVLIRGDNK